MKIQGMKITEKRINELLRQAEADLPKPKALRLYPSQDHDGDAIFRLEITYGRSVSPEESAWKRVFPFISALQNELSETIDLPIFDRIIRLSESETAYA